MIWDIMFDGDLFSKHEPVGCTPYLLMGGATVGIFSFILDMIPIFLENYLFILVASISFTAILPIIDYIRTKSKQIVFIDFIYIILSLINSIIGCLVGFSSLYLVLYHNFENVILNQKKSHLLIMFFIGYLFFRIFQNIIWNLGIRTIFKERKI